MGTQEDRIVATCPACGKQFHVRAESIGKRAKCRGCGQPFEIQTEADSEMDLDAFAEAPPIPQSPPMVSAAVRKPAARTSPQAADGAAVGLLKKIGSVIVIAFCVVVIGFFGWMRISGQQARRANLTRMIEQRERDRVDEENDARRAKEFAREAAQPRPSLLPPAQAKPAPQLTFATDSAGRRIGTAKAAMRSAATLVKLVLPPGDHAAHSLPCIFVCPAGSTLLTGTSWGDDEQEDFYGLLERGMAVCFYSLDGTFQSRGDATDDMMFSLCARQFLTSGGGLGNVQDAIDTVLASAPAVDPTKLGAAGHSSAGTVGLTAARGDSRIVAVAAMAPAIDLPKRLASIIEQLDGPSTAAIYKMSPSGIEKLTADVFIYHASDDANTSAADSSAFAVKHGAKVTLQLVPTGGHGGAYEQGRFPAFDFLAKRFGAMAMPGAGKIAESETPAAGVPTPRQPRASRPTVDSSDASQASQGAAPVATPAPAAPQRIVRAPAPQTRPTAGATPAVAMPKVAAPTTQVVKAGAIALRVGVLPTGQQVRPFTIPGSFAIRIETEPGQQQGSVIGFSVEEDKVPSLVVMDAPQGDGRMGRGFIVDDSKLAMPATVPKIVDGLGGRVAFFSFDDTQSGEDTREAVVAFQIDKTITLLWISFPRAQAGRVDEVVKSMAAWKIDQPAGAKPKPYVKTIKGK